MYRNGVAVAVEITGGGSQQVAVGYVFVLSFTANSHT